MIKNNYIGLVFECPFQSELENCPFSFTLQLDIKDRIDLYNKYPNEEFINMLCKHIQCFTERESRVFINKPKDSLTA